MNNSTLDYYNQNSELFTDDTQSADMRINQDRFLHVLNDTHPGIPASDLSILDLGCGTGRDTKYYLDHGYRVDATDGSEEMVRIAAQYNGIPVKLQLFEELEGHEIYDAVWACASILHMRRDSLPDMFRRVWDLLNAGGIFYASFKYGAYEGYRKERYYTDLDEEGLEDILKTVSGFGLIDLWISQDVRPGREEEKWLNFILQKDQNTANNTM